jgi:hypothetical protein
MHAFPVPHSAFDAHDSQSAFGGDDGTHWPFVHVSPVRQSLAFTQARGHSSVFGKHWRPPPPGCGKHE